MKIRKYLLHIVLLLCLASCTKDYTNPNAPTEEESVSSRQGLFAIAIGVKQYYATFGFSSLVANGLVTRELAATNTFTGLLELEEGGGALTPENSYVNGIWNAMNKTSYMCNQLLDNAEKVDLSPETRNSMKAYAQLYKAMALGQMAEFFTNGIITQSKENNAAFFNRDSVLKAAIALLENADALLAQTPISQEFNNAVIKSELDVKNCANAFLSRYYLLTAQYAKAITAGLKVNLTVKSQFVYDAQNTNPIYTAVYVGVQNVAPRDNFGLPAVQTGDKRREFYLEPLAANSTVNNIPIEKLKGFFDANKAVPVYLPGEVMLNLAEAYARSSQLNSAVQYLDMVRTKTNDIFGVNATLPPYTGAATQPAILEDIYYNRCVELFLQGLRLEDSRRFGRPAPPNTPDFYSERSRNYFPFPASERLNNKNTPGDPAI